MKSKTYSLFLFLIIAMSFLLLSYFNFEYYLTNIASDYSVYVIMLVFAAGYLYIKDSSVSIKRDKVYKAIIFFTILSLFTQLPYLLGSNFNSIIRNLMHNFAILLGLLLGQAMAHNLYLREGYNKSRNLLILLLMLPIFYTAYRYLSVIIVDPDSLFYITLLFPLVFCLNKDLYKIIAFILVGIICAISAKRSILIAYSFCLFIFILQYSILNRKNKKSAITNAIMLIGILLGVYWLIQSNSEVIDHITLRFQSISEDNGSGRQDIYDQLWKAYNNNPIMQKMFGNGYRSAVAVLGGVPAHNDMLEILYDFGILTLLCYIYILVRYLLIVVKELKKISLCDEVSMLLVSVFNIIVLGSLNNIFIDTVFIMTAFMCIGIAERRIYLSTL